MSDSKPTKKVKTDEEREQIRMRRREERKTKSINNYFLKLENKERKKEKNVKNKKRTNDELKKTLFVGRLAPSVTEEILRSKFEKYGEIEHVRFIWKDFDNFVHKGCAYLQFKKRKGAEKATELNGTLIEGREIRANLEIEKNIHKSNQHTLYLTGLSYDTDEESIKNYFKTFGKVTRVSIPVWDDSKKRKGFAFVDFEDFPSMQKALEAKEVEIDSRMVYIEKYNPEKRHTAPQIIEEKKEEL